VYVTFLILFRKKYRSIQAAAGTLQRWVRGFLARRKTRGIRRTRAATRIQALVRGFIQV